MDPVVGRDGGGLTLAPVDGQAARAGDPVGGNDGQVHLVVAGLSDCQSASPEGHGFDSDCVPLAWDERGDCYYRWEGRGHRCLFRYDPES